MYKRLSLKKENVDVQVNVVFVSVRIIDFRIINLRENVYKRSRAQDLRAKVNTVQTWGLSWHQTNWKTYSNKNRSALHALCL